MRVLQINTRYYGGGAERAARDLFTHLCSVGVDTQMWTALREKNTPSGVHSLRWPGERYGRVFDYLPIINDWRHFGSIWNLGRLTPRDVDLVHLHNIHGNWISIRALHNLCRRFPVVWTLHDEWAATGGMACDLSRVMDMDQARIISRPASRFLLLYPSPRVQRWRRFLARYMPQPKAIICPSQHHLELVRASGYFPSTQLYHVLNGLTMLERPEIDSTISQARQKWGLPVQGPVVMLIAAQLTAPYKGIDLAVRTLRSLDLPGKPYVLLLGRDAHTLRSSLEGMPVVSAYTTDDAQLATAYRAADVTLIPSLADNLPYIALESLACERPIVAFQVGGLPQIVGKNQRGYLAPPFDIEQLGQGLRLLLKDSLLREQLGKAGRLWVREHCTMDKFIGRINAIYRSCLSSAGH